MQASLFLSLVTLAAPALAASGGLPLTLSHAGLLLDGSDAPIDAPAIPMKFRIWDRSAAIPTQVLQWEATCAVAVRGGHFALLLGTGACAGTEALDSADVPSGEARWLELEVNGVTLQPRQPINPSAVAVAAQRALGTDQLGGLAPGSYWQSGDDFAGATLGAGTVGAHTHGHGSIDGLAAAATAAVASAGLPWSSVSGVTAASDWPGTLDVARVTNAASTFAPIAHAHAGEDVTSGTLALARLDTGSGHGLDADLVDGQHASAFANTTHTHVGAGVTDLAAALPGVLANGTIPGNLALTGVLKPGTPTTCGPTQEGTLRWEPTGKAIEVCNGSAWTRIGGTTNTLGTSTNPATNCRALRDAGQTVSATYWVDPDGVGGNAAFEANCEMQQDGGGWTHVITPGSASVLTTGAVGAIGDATFKFSDAVINMLFANTSARELYVNFSGSPMILLLPSPFALAAQAPQWRYPPFTNYFGPCSHAAQIVDNSWFFIKTSCNPAANTCNACQSSNFENGVRASNNGFYSNDGANVWRGFGWNASFKLYVR